MSANSRPNRAIASSPGPAPQTVTSDHALEQVSVRPMRLKVLYTFDSENKTNHLARWPHPLDIQSAYLDGNTQIGVIELKTCIQAIAAASPEVVAKLSHDFTVYAYDYSEYETPLVGQGMLSWILASSSTTPAAPAHQSRTMVTGRVCRNALGLFTSNSQETLEVKLRLVPVPTSLQSEYIESMKKYREVSQLMPPGLDPQAWSSFVQANPGFMPQALHSRSQSPAMGPGQQAMYGIEQVQRLMSGDGRQQGAAESRRPLSRANSYANSESVQQLPRMPSPALSVQSTASAPKRRGRPPADRKKPGPKGPRNRAASRKPEIAPQSNDTGYGSNDEGTAEDGPAKKRAKVIQAEWSSKQDFAKQPESLRVAASTAASVRIHQPTAMRPGANPAHSLEVPPREPTPIGNPKQRPRPLLPTARSSLRESIVHEKKVYAMPFPSTTVQKSAEYAVTSPENSRIGSSPPEMGSSPPVFGGSTAPCSPNLLDLPLPDFDDSGFMSGSIDDLFEDDELRPNDDDFDTLAQYTRRPESPMLPPPKIDDYERMKAANGEPPEMTVEEKAIAKSRQSARSAAGMSRTFQRTASSGDLLAPQLPASDPVRPSGLSRSQTWSGNHASHPASDVAPVPQIMDSIERPGPRNRRQSETGTGSGVKRKAAIQSKLATSIAAGEMPPFCENCGSIDTPTWRKAWVKIHSGTPEHVRISEDEGGIWAWQTLQTDHTGTVCLYRIIKKTISKTDEGFSEILLCNPCGIFLHSRKCMRPRSAWDKSQKGPDDKGSKGPSGKRPRGGSLSNATKDERQTGNATYSDRSPPAGGQTENSDAGPQVAATKRFRASSVERTSAEGSNIPMDDASAAVALQQAIQASPHKFRGTSDVPIEVGDLTPQPTRRLLFPSPSKSQEAISKRNSMSRTVESPCDTSTDNPPPADKENRPPPSHASNTNASSNIHPNPAARATTPTSPPTSKPIVFKTPSRTPSHRGPPPTTGDFFSSAAKALLRPDKTLTPKRTPTRNSSIAHPLEELSPFTAHLNQLLSEPHYDNNNTDGCSPAASHHSFTFPSLPSLHNTPGRGTINTHHSRIMDDFDFSAFDSQDLISTDVPMPSSPPAWFGIYSDDVDIMNLDDTGVGGGGGGGGGGGSLWGNHDNDHDDILPIMTGSSPLKAASRLTSPAKRKTAITSSTTMGGLGDHLFGDFSPPHSKLKTPREGRHGEAEEEDEEGDGAGRLLSMTMMTAVPSPPVKPGVGKSAEKKSEGLVGGLV